jgi:hypothetical protein
MLGGEEPTDKFDPVAAREASERARKARTDAKTNGYRVPEHLLPNNNDGIYYKIRTEIEKLRTMYETDKDDIDLFKNDASKDLNSITRNIESLNIAHETGKNDMLIIENKIVDYVDIICKLLKIPEEQLTRIKESPNKLQEIRNLLNAINNEYSELFIKNELIPVDILENKNNINEHNANIPDLLKIVSLLMNKHSELNDKLTGITKLIHSLAEAEQTAVIELEEEAAKKRMIEGGDAAIEQFENLEATIKHKCNNNTKHVINETRNNDNISVRKLHVQRTSNGTLRYSVEDNNGSPIGHTGCFGDDCILYGKPAKSELDNYDLHKKILNSQVEIAKNYLNMIDDGVYDTDDKSYNLMNHVVKRNYGGTSIADYTHKLYKENKMLGGTAGLTANLFSDYLGGKKIVKRVKKTKNPITDKPSEDHRVDITGAIEAVKRKKIIKRVKKSKNPVNDVVDHRVSINGAITAISKKKKRTKKSKNPVDDTTKVSKVQDVSEVSDEFDAIITDDESETSNKKQKPKKKEAADDDETEEEVAADADDTDDDEETEEASDDDSGDGFTGGLMM